MSIMLFFPPLYIMVKGTRSDWEPPEGFPNSHCLLHELAQPPGDAPGPRSEAGFYLAAEAPIYPTTHSIGPQRFLLLASETPEKIWKLILGESEPRRKCTVLYTELYYVL